MGDDVITIRQHWSARTQPLIAIMGSAVLWLRTLELIHWRFAGVVTILAVALVAVPLRRVFREARQKLIIDEVDLIYVKAGKRVIHNWKEITQLRRTGPNEFGKGQHGLMVVCESGPSLSLNNSWSLPREELITLLASHLQPNQINSTPIVFGQDTQVFYSNKSIKIALIATFFCSRCPSGNAVFLDDYVI